MRLFVESVLMAALLLGPGSVQADVYTWVDENGTVHFADEPPARARRARKVVLPEEAPPAEPEKPAPASTGSAPDPAAARPPAPPPASARKPLPRVELYTTSWCPHCKRARAYFAGRGIPFTEHDIETEPGAGARLQALAGNQAVPTAVIGDKVVSGYSPSAYQAALGPR